MGRTFSRTARLRSCLAIGASFAALAVSQNAHAQAQLCPNGQPGPVCTIENTGTSGPIVGTNGNVTVVSNSGTITGAPAIQKGGSVGLLVENQEGGTITGTAGVAIQSGLGLVFRTVNSGTINGDVVFNDAPAPNAFTGMLSFFVSDGGTLNGNLQLGTTGFSASNFLMRGSDDGVTGTISAGAGLDIFTKIYETSQTLTLGQYALPATFEIEGYYAEGVDTILTLAGASTTISLSGDGTVINNATISPVSTAGLYPPGTEVLAGAIGYYQTSVAVFPRPGIAPGQPQSFFTVPFGSALTSFTNNGVVNGEIQLSTASFLNTGDINLATHSGGSTIYGAADTAFVFDNQGTIEMAVNGNRLPSILPEFDDGLAAALRLRSAINTTAAADITITNSGAIVGGLDMRFAAEDFFFENTGSIEGIDVPGGYFVPGLIMNVGQLRMVAGQDPETHYDAATATIINGETGSIDHYFEANLSAFEVTFENHGFIAGSDANPDALWVGQLLDADDTDATSFSFVNTGSTEGNVGLEGLATTFTVDNSGTVEGREFPVNNVTYPNEIMWGGDTAFEIYNGTTFGQTFDFTNSGTIATTGHAASGVAIEVEAGDGDPDPGDELVIADALVTVTNSGTISATGGATLVPQQFATFLQPGQFLINPLAALAVDATDVSGEAVISITNEAGGLIRAGGTLNTATPTGYVPITTAPADVFTVAIFATGKTVNITNSGTIQGGAGTTVGPNAILNEGDLYDSYLAGAIQTTGDEYGPDDIYVASIDHVTNTATGTIIGSIDLGGNDDVIDNAGSITGDVYLRDGNDALENYGTLTGNVFFGAGDDTFTQGINATFTGTADGGDGADKFFLDITGGGTINQAIYDQLINFETLALTGSGTIGTGGGEPLPVETIELTGEEPVQFGPDAVIETQGETAVTGSASGDEVSNQGTINGNVDLGAGGDDLDNSGTINGTVDLGEGENQFANTGEVNGDIAGGDEADTVQNEGTINGTVNLGGGGNQFANSGEVNGDVNAGDDNDSIVNEGTITGDVNLDGDGAQAIAALAGFKTTQALGGGDDEFENDGTLDGNVFAGGGDDVVTNSGAITGDVDLGDGNDELVLVGDWAIGGTATGGTGSDTLDVTFGAATTNAPVLDLSGFESFETFEVSGGTGKIGGDAVFGQINLAGGRLIGAAGSHITGNVAVSTGATFGSAGLVTGNIAVASGGTLSPGASPAVMTVTGNVSLASGSTTVFEFVPAPGQSDQLLIDGNLTIASGAVLNMTGNRPLTPGVAYDMIVADAITGQFTIGTWDHSAIQGFLRYVDGSTADRLQLFGTFVFQGTAAPQANAAIDYVNSLLVGGTASTALLGAVPSLLETNGFASAAAFTLLTPEPYASATQLGVESGLSLAKVSRNGMGRTDRESAGLFAIAEAFGNWRSLDADATLGTSKAKNRDYGLIGGLGFGSADASLGAFVGYVEGRQRIDALGSETDADGITAGLTGHVGSAGFSFDALVGYDWGDAETARAVPGGAAVSSDYELENFVADAVASYELPLGGVSVIPAVGLTHIETKRGAASETGSAAFALDVDSDKHSSTFIDGSVAVSGTAGGIRPWAEVGIRYQLDGEVPVASAGLTGSTARFFVPGAPRDDTVFTAGAGIEADLAPNVSLTASYNGEFGGGTGSTAAIGLKAAF